MISIVNMYDCVRCNMHSEFCVYVPPLYTHANEIIHSDRTRATLGLHYIDAQSYYYTLYTYIIWYDSSILELCITKKPEARTQITTTTIHFSRIHNIHYTQTMMTNRTKQKSPVGRARLSMYLL